MRRHIGNVSVLINVQKLPRGSFDEVLSSCGMVWESKHTVPASGKAHAYYIRLRQQVDVRALALQKGELSPRTLAINRIHLTLLRGRTSI